MKDFAPTTGRTSVRGLRSKSAVRRRERRRTRHRQREERSQEARQKRIRADRRRRADGWWPPKPLEGQPKPLPVPFATGLRLGRDEHDD